MARTIQQIQQEIIACKEQEPLLSSLNSTSKVSIWRLWTYIFAYAIYTLELIFDQHKTYVDNALAQKTPHTARWYKNKALAFQWQCSLKGESDVFDNASLTDEQIQVSKIIKYAAVTEATGESRLIVKIATEKGGELSPITTDQHIGFQRYISQIKDAGVNVTIINYLPDVLTLNLDIYYNPLVLDSGGSSMFSPSPVKDAVNGYMKNLPFNGELVIAHLVDVLQGVEGVEIPHLAGAFTSWIEGNNYSTPQPISVSAVAQSGYFKVNWEGSKINYIPRG